MIGYSQCPGDVIVNHPLRTGPSVILEGDGIACACVARLLTDAGLRCALKAQPRSKVTAILLGQQTQHLLRELFPADQDQDCPQDLFSGFTPIARRIVLWEDAPAPLSLPHRGVVAPEGELLRRLWSRIPAPAPLDPSLAPHTQYRVVSSPSAEPLRQERSFGSRTGRIAQVELREEAEQESCWVESVDAGWLFLLALGGGMGSLIAAGGSVETLLSSSRLVAERIQNVLSETPPIPVFPRLSECLAGPGAIACGSAAMSFDPLCGEGAGHALREGILAAAVIRAALAGGPATSLAEHYSIRLKQGMLRHLEACLPFYTTGGTAAFWQEESESLRRGITLLQGELSHLPQPRFRLVDRDLVPL